LQEVSYLTVAAFPTSRATRKATEEEEEEEKEEETARRFGGAVMNE
jgi:hypothetical protein